MPLISVIIPAYNAEKTIQETIESVLNQTLSDFEIIVINDGSQDKTLDILSTISDPRLQVFSYPNAGGAVSRNRGFKHSTGELIAFLDADDVWTPDKLEAQWQALQANPDAKVAYCWTDLIDQSSRRLGPCCHITANGNVFAQLLLTCFVVSGSNPLMYRQAFIDINGFDESLTASQDFDLYLRLAARYQFVTVPSPKLFYRISGNSMSSNMRRLEETSLMIRKRHFDQSPESLSPLLKRHSIANFYKSIIFRVLNDAPDWRQGLEGFRLMAGIIQYDPGILIRGIMVKLVLKSLVMIVLPPAIAQYLFNQFKSLFNIRAITGYIRIDPSTLS
ncbi:MAG TPA: glycosyltransferase [Crinalium sp.]|jgi:glycosyltransferase involved in cell wall biosynthesis